MEKIEIELKLPLKNINILIRKLNEISEFKGEYNQKDTYYVPHHRNFVKQSPIFEWLRIREFDKENKKISILNYKNFGKDMKEDTISCRELETEFENPKTLRNIFESLDIKEIIIVKKNRKDYQYKNTLISIDCVEELGDFIEIEFEGVAENEEKAKKYLHKILKEIEAEVGEVIFKGYPHLLLEKEGYFHPKTPS